MAQFFLEKSSKRDPIEANSVYISKKFFALLAEVIILHVWFTIIYIENFGIM